MAKNGPNNSTTLEKKDKEQRRRTNEELEKRVAERTAELLRANELLQKEIEERKRAEEALRESESNFRALADNSTAAIFIVREEKFVYINKNFRENSGYTLEDLQAVPFWSIISPEMRDQIRANAAARRQDSAPKHYELKIRTKSGEEKITQVGVTGIEFNKKPAILGLVVDITERKRMEEALRSSQEAAQAILNATQEAMFLIDASGTILAINTAAARRLRAGPLQMIGRCIYDFLPADVARTRKAAGEEVIRTGRPIALKDERMGRYFDSVVYPVCDEAGQVTRMVVYSHDVTERKQMEEQLRKSRDELERRVKERTAELEESHERFRLLADLLPEMVFETDLQGNHTYANRLALDIFGLTSEDLKRGFNIRDAVAPKDHHRVMENAKKIIDGEERSGAEYTVRRKDGSEFPAFVHATRIERNGQVVGLRGIVIDLTEARRAEAERMRLEEQLHQSQKLEALGTLAGGIAHDFNNVLAIVLGNAELALEDLKGNSGPERNINQIIDASKRARQLIKQILAFSRKTERGKTPLALTPLIKDTFTLLRGTLPTTIRLELDLQSKSDTVLADPSQMEQVLMNLSTNAAYAMRENGGVLTIRLSEVVVKQSDRIPGGDLRPGAYLKLAVEDTGTGMTQKVRRRIFEPFFTTKKPGQGTGMGLAVVYGIVKNHEGTITVESKPGRGSVFTVFLPYAQAEAAGQKEDASEIAGGSERLLLVDDEPAITEAASATLRRLGYHVTTAESGSEAWHIFTKDPHAFDLIITDQTMPDLTGVDLAERMLAVRKDAPIILLTGYSEMVSAEQAKKVGIRDFIMKPIAKREMAETIRRVLDT